MVQTLAADHKRDLGLGLDEDVALQAGVSLSVNNCLLLSLVLGLILLGLGQVKSLLILEMLLMILLQLGSIGSNTCLTFLKFQNVLWYGLSSDLSRRRNRLVYSAFILCRTNLRISFKIYYLL